MIMFVRRFVMQNLVQVTDRNGPEWALRAVVQANWLLAKWWLDFFAGVQEWVSLICQTVSLREWPMR